MMVLDFVATIREKDREIQLLRQALERQSINPDDHSLFVRKTVVTFKSSWTKQKIEECWVFVRMLMWNQRR